MKTKSLIVICFLRLEDLPPAVSMLKSLSQKYSIEYIGVNSKSDYYCNLFGEQVHFHNIIPYECSEKVGIKGKIKKSIYRRKMRLWYKGSMKLIKKYLSSSEAVWVLHEYTIMNIGYRILKIPYYLTMYELHGDLFCRNNNLLKKCIQKAEKVITPEYTRAAIVQACAGLKNMPKIIPNKPYEYSDMEIELRDNQYSEIANKIHSEGRKIILYAGIFLRERKLETIIQAVDKMREKYEMVLIGQNSKYLEELLQQYPFIRYWGFIKAPKHLSIIKLADIGVLTYVSDTGSINPVFCAPNKIWEYAKYGIPMLCNDIPGLKFTVEYNNFGCCCNINSIEDITNKIEYINLHYKMMNRNAADYYNSVNVMDLVDQVIEKRM